MSSNNSPKNIIFNFDGTGQDANSADNVLGNVPKLHLMFGGDFENDHQNEHYKMPNQVSLYYNGVGTYGSPLRRAFAYAFGGRDVDEILNDAVGHLGSIYKAGDKVYVTGFSRGAAIARRFCAQISKEDGLRDVKVEILVCFDTVASIGLPDVSAANRPKAEVLFEDKKVAPNVLQALHCCSIDENRSYFQPTLMNKDDRVTEVWFAGDHSDIGGGHKSGDDLADTVLQFVLDELKRRKVGLQILEQNEIQYETISEFIDQDDDVQIDDDCLGQIHGSSSNGFLQDDRAIVVIENDVPISDPPIIHHSVFQRMSYARLNYRPENLVGLDKSMELLRSGLIVEHTTQSETRRRSSVKRKYVLIQ